MSNFLLYKRISLSNPRPPSGNSPPPATSSAKLKGASQFIRPVPGRLWETLGQHISLLSLLRRNSAAGRRQLYGAGREAWRLPARPAWVGHSADNFWRPVQVRVNPHRHGHTRATVNYWLTAERQSTWQITCQVDCLCVGNQCIAAGRVKKRSEESGESVKFEIGMRPV